MSKKRYIPSREMFHMEFIREVGPGDVRNKKVEELKLWEYIRRKYRKEKSERKSKPWRCPYHTE